MLIAITIASILALTGLVALVNRILPFAVCPICAGSFLTWVGLVGAHIAGYAIDLTVPAVLMGGSVVGIAYQAEKKFWRTASAPMLWKALFMPTGFLAAYAVLEAGWIALAFLLTFLAVVTYLFAPRQGERPAAVKGLEKKMEDCC